MQPFHQCLAFGPVAVYLLLVGMINLSRRPHLVTGVRDMAVLCLAISGLVVLGPLGLLYPEGLAVRLGAAGPKLVWLILTVFYILCFVLLLLLLRPRLVIYNIPADQLRPILAELVERIDSEARWAGDCLQLPGLGVQLLVDSVAWMRNVSLLSAGPRQSEAGWRRLENELRTALATVEVPRNPRGVTFFSIGLFVVGVLGYAIAHDPHGLAITVFDLLRS